MVGTLMNAITLDFRSILGHKLVGVYVHGSIAFGCFRWETSDIDFLAVVNSPLTHEEKVALINVLLARTPDAPEKGLEMSVVLSNVCRNFVYPTPYELHFSNAHLHHYTEDADSYCEILVGNDPDLAGHFAVTKAVGIAWYGLPVDEVFGDVPRAALMASILLDVEDSRDNLMSNPPYFILNLCRTIACKEEGRMLSKAGGGEWALEHLPDEYHPVIRSALNAYTLGERMNLDCAEAFRDYALARLKD